jgi:hypothetical protein
MGAGHKAQKNKLRSDPSLSRETSVAKVRPASIFSLSHNHMSTAPYSTHLEFRSVTDAVVRFPPPMSPG